MSTLEPTSFLYEIAEGKPIPTEKLAYFQGRLKFNLYDFILSKFTEMETKEGLTKAELARRIGCKPEQITRRLGAPGNWTLDTISDLLIGISGEELKPTSQSIFDRPARNNSEKTWREKQHFADKASSEPEADWSSATHANLGQRKASAARRLNINSQNEPSARPSLYERATTGVLS